MYRKKAPKNYTALVYVTKETAEKIEILKIKKCKKLEAYQKIFDMGIDYALKNKNQLKDFIDDAAV